MDEMSSNRSFEKKPKDFISQFYYTIFSKTENWSLFDSVCSFTYTRDLSSCSRLEQDTNPLLPIPRL